MDRKQGTKILWACVGAALLWMSCGENQIIFPGSGGPDTIPVSAFVFSPKRKYVSNGEWVKVEAVGFHRGFVCSEITEMTGLEYQPDHFRPVMVVRHPPSVTACAATGVEGEDSIFSLNFSNGAGADRPVILSNSVFVPTDTAVVTAKPHRLSIADTQIVLPGTTPLNTDSLLDWWLGNLTLPCGEVLSYGKYCWVGDTLRVSVWSTTGWGAAQCSGSLSNLQDRIYFTEVTADPVEGCLLGSW